MTTDLKRLMHATATDAPSAANLLSGSRAAAHRIRRRRRVMATATAGTALGAAGLIVRTGLPMRGAVDSPGTGLRATSSVPSKPPAAVVKTPAGTPDPAAADLALPDCSESIGSIKSTRRDIGSGELALRLLSSDAAYQLEQVQAWETTDDCLKPTAALTLTDAGADGVIHRAVTVWGPRRTPFSLAAYKGSLTHTKVRGVDAQVLTIGRSLQVAWTESPGQNWKVTGTGLDLSALKKIAESLEINTGSAVMPDVPAGFRLEVRSAAARVSPKQKEWYAVYKTATESLPLGSSEGAGLLAQWVSMGEPDMYRFTTVRGHRALAEPAKDGKFVALHWEEAPGVQVTVTSDTGATQAAAFAESLQPVTAGDARIGLKLRTALLGADTTALAPPKTLSPDGSSAPASASSASSASSAAP